ncbi:hypothetical protein [Pedobacter miscanthi]|uniref:hypothetical protein n=1 Tax=Pedobacter miscanthi TaxID=2259170 RepID=UPI0011BFD43E|nr:hypothetical protein [Pedobacter miscanthi]
MDDVGWKKSSSRLKRAENSYRVDTSFYGAMLVCFEKQTDFTEVRPSILPIFIGTGRIKKQLQNRTISTTKHEIYRDGENQKTVAK